jgi:hypothetical protein
MKHFYIIQVFPFKSTILKLFCPIVCFPVPGIIVQTQETQNTGHNRYPDCQVPARHEPSGFCVINPGGFL